MKTRRTTSATFVINLEKDELEKKLKFRDDMIDRLTSKSKDRRGWPSFELANSSGSEQTNAEDKLRKNPKW